MNNQKTCILTPQGKAKLEAELVALRADRPAALASLQQARAMGDLKENSAYQAARERLTNLDRRIIKLELTLRNCQVIEKTDTDAVQLGSIVEVEHKGVKIAYTIVGDMEMDLRVKKISLKSPLGIALGGHKKGDVIKFKTPAGEAIYTILSVV